MENVEVYKIDGVDVKGLVLEDISEWIISNWTQDLSFHKTAKRVLVRLDNKNYKSNWISENFDDRTPTFFHRMSEWRDLSNVVIYYYNSSGQMEEKSYCVDYEEENPLQLGSPNKNQHAHLDTDDNEIIIEIWRNE